MKRYNKILILTLIFTVCLVSIATIPNIKAADPNDTIAYWNFDEGSGAILTDNTPNNHDGELSGGKFGNALEFDGFNDYVEIPYDIGFGSAFTIEAWIYPTASGRYQMIVTKDTSTYFTNYNLQITSSNKLRFFISGLSIDTVSSGSGYINGTGIAIDGSSTISTNEWYHVAGVYTGTDIQVYLQGSLDGSATVTGSPTTNSENVWIGKRKVSAHPFPFEGKIDEVMISNVARSTFTTSSKLESDGSTVALWRFDESIDPLIDTMVYDVTSNNYDGTIYGAVWAGPIWTNGLFGTALKFDGIDDNVILDENEFSNTDLDEYTFEAWIYIDSLDSVERRIFDDEGGLRPMLNSANKLEAFHWDSTAWTSKTITWSTAPLTLTWYHIAQSYDGSDLKFYINGELIGSISCDAWEPDGLNREVNLGSWWQGLGKNWKGLLDEMRIWNYALPDEEIKMHSWGLVGEWLFESDSGLTAYDTSGYGNDGTVAGTPIWSVGGGRFGNALEFDGSNYVDLGLNVDNFLTDEVTIEAWIYPHTKQRGGILSSDLTYNSPHKGFDFFLWDSNDPNGTLYLDFGNGATLGRMWYTIPSMDWYNQWHHVAGTWDGSSMKLYVDGVESTHSYTGTYEDSDRPTLIGAISSTSVLYKYDGMIDEVRIWNKALAPITFHQSGLDCSATGELVVTVSDPIPLNYEDIELPFIMMAPSGTNVDYNFESLISGGSGKQFVLQDVTGGASPSDTAIAPANIVGNYITQYYLTVNDGGHGTAGGEGWYTENTNAQATITPLTVAGSAGVQYVFDGWTVDASGSGSPSDNIFMDGPKTATATWETQYYLTVNDGGHGTAGGEGWYAENTNVQATITPLTVAGSAGVQYVFDGWTVDASGSGSPSDNIFMDGPKTATATWETQYYLTVLTYESGITTIAGEGWYAAGTTVILKATDVYGYTFMYWDVDGTPRSDWVKKISVVMTEPLTATAHYYTWITVSGYKYNSLDGSTSTTHPKLSDWEIKLYSLKEDFDSNYDGWTDYSGTWNVEGGELSGESSGSEEAWIWYNQPFSGDITIEFRMKFIDTPGDTIGRHGGVMSFSADETQRWATDGYTIDWIDRPSDHGFRIYKWVDGSFSLLGVIGSTYSMDDSWHDWKIIKNLNTIKLYIDEVYIGEVNDMVSPYVSGYVGFWLYQNNQHVHFDDVSIYSSDITDVNGYYEIPITLPGTYCLEEVLWDGWTKIYPTDPCYSITVLPDDEDIEDKNFWNFKWATISGTKYDIGEGFCDDFEIYELGSDGTPIWTPDTPGTWSIVDDGIHGQVYYGTMVGRAFSNIDIDTDSMIINTDFKALDSSPPTGWANGFIIFDYQDSNNFKRAGLGVGDPRYIIDGFIGGVKTDSLQIPAPGIVKETWYNLKVEIIDNTVYLYIDGELKADYTYSSIGDGKIGVETGTAESYFDNFCFKPKIETLDDWTFKLYDGLVLIEEDTTESDGEYELIVKNPGTYQIKEVVKSGWTMVYPDITPNQYGLKEFLGYEQTVESGDEISGLDFWNFEWTTISGVKFFDGDGDGEYDTGEPGLQGWDIKLYKDGTVYGSDMTDINGEYEIEIKNPGIYKVNELLNSALDWWIQTTPEHTFTASSDESETYNFGNWIGSSIITTSNLCWFDKDEADGQQFRIIFTPDINSDPNLYKVSATNPGQFYYNIFFSGELTEDIIITLPTSFETQGANPVHVYSSLYAEPDGCLIPEVDISDQFDIIQDGNLITVSPTDAFTSGFLYITVHCDYALKQTGGYEQHLYEDTEGIWRAHADLNNVIAIEDLDDHTFCVSGAVTDCQTIQNRNEFKKIRGIAGLIDGATEGDAVTISGPCIPNGEVIVFVDEDGFYGYSFHHKGKIADYTVDPEGWSLKTEKLKAGRFAEVNFP